MSMSRTLCLQQNGYILCGSILFDLETADGMALKGRFEGNMEYIDGYYNPKDSLEKVNILRIRNKIRQAK